MSSAGLRAALATLAGTSRTRIDSACGPRLPSATPNSTRVPGLSASTPAGQRGGVHEHLVTLLGGEEAEALLAVVPLDLAGGHRTHASFVVEVRRAVAQHAPAQASRPRLPDPNSVMRPEARAVSARARRASSSASRSRVIPGPGPSGGSSTQVLERARRRSVATGRTGSPAARAAAGLAALAPIHGSPPPHSGIVASLSPWSSSHRSSTQVSGRAVGRHRRGDVGEHVAEASTAAPGSPRGTCPRRRPRRSRTQNDPRSRASITWIGSSGSPGASTSPPRGDPLHPEVNRAGVVPGADDVRRAHDRGAVRRTARAPGCSTDDLERAVRLAR